MGRQRAAGRPSPPVEVAPAKKRQARMPTALRAKNAATAIEARERARVAVALKSTGATYEQIREHLGLKSRKTVGNIISREAKKLLALDPNIEEQRRVQLESLEERARRWKQIAASLARRQAKDEELSAEQVLLLAKAEQALATIHDQRVRLLGLERPRESIKVVVEGELQQAIDHMRGALDAETFKKVLAVFVDPATAQGVLKGVVVN